MSNQRVFDEALKHIRKQGEPSMYGTTCKYQHGELGCAFAPCIKEYDVEMEGGSASLVMRKFPSNLHEWALDANTVLCYEVQSAHDSSCKNDFMADFEEKMKRIAAKYDLEYSR